MNVDLINICGLIYQLLEANNNFMSINYMKMKMRNYRRTKMWKYFAIK